MTPEAVIYRYLELVDPGHLDLDALVRLVTSDADLLSRWLRILQVPADYAVLVDRLGALSADELKGIADAQVWTVSPTPDSARLSLDQWQSVLRAAYLAQVLVERSAHPDGLSGADAETGASIRMRALLALSGVHLENDDQLSDLIAFRGARPDLLEDAAIEIRVFAVVDGLELGRDEQIAAQVLGISAHEYHECYDQAEALVSAAVQALLLDSDPDVDWSHRIWLRQQVSVATAAFQDCQSMADMVTKHTQVSRTLFARAPLMLIQDDDLESFTLYPDNTVTISRASRSSVVAKVARNGGTSTIADNYDIAVVDRQLLQRLGSEHAICRATQTEPAVVFVADADDDLDVDAAIELYVEAFERHTPKASVVEPNDRLEQFRVQEITRLREVVHEANNPLSIVHNYLHILELRFQDDPTTSEQLRLIASELGRAGEIFLRARDVPDVELEEPYQSSERAELEIVRWLQGIHQVSEPTFTKQGLEFHFQTTIASFDCVLHRGEVHQIVTNLLKNAGEATPSGGRVGLSFNHQHFRNGTLGIEIEVADSGPGLPVEVLENLVGPKVSTKGGDHQGLGLHLVYRLVGEIGAQLDLRTSSRGTTFSLFIPLE